MTEPTSHDPHTHDPDAHDPIPDPAATSTRVGDLPGDGGSFTEGDPAAEQPSSTPGMETHRGGQSRSEFTPLYAMAGLADLAAAVVRDLVNEQITAFQARRAQPSADQHQAGEQEKSEFNAFLQTAQQRTQELYDQALQQYSHLAERGRGAVGEVMEHARAQRVRAGDRIEDGAQGSADDLSRAAERLADRVAAAARAAADRVGRTARAEGPDDQPEGPTMGSDVSEDAGTGDLSTGVSGDEPIPGTPAQEPTTLEHGAAAADGVPPTSDSGVPSTSTDGDSTTWPTDR